jgi:flavin reductase (DIM6/NTAB) family NADH-FMN oxidoreductase RutF
MSRNAKADTATIPEPAFSPRDLRDALGCFATGVAVITAVAPSGERIGATVSSFNSVSLDPPLVLFSVARSAKAFAIWEKAEYFAVNLLAEHQQQLSNRFAKAHTDKWSGVETTDGETGVPLLDRAIVSFECARFAAYDGGDHLILVGRVLAIAGKREQPATPLVFYRSRYRRLDHDPGSEPPLDTDAWIHGW